MDKLIWVVFLRIFAFLCMLAVPCMFLYIAYDTFMVYNEDGMILLEGFAIFALGAAFIFFTFITWVLAIEAILYEPKRNKDKED